METVAYAKVRPRGEAAKFTIETGFARVMQ